MDWFTKMNQTFQSYTSEKGCLFWYDLKGYPAWEEADLSSGGDEETQAVNGDVDADGHSSKM